MKKIAIIPARGGSKRIPKKNLKSFFGKPIISYAIELAIKSNIFDEIVVSTDCQETAEVAVSYGAKVPFYRSIENSGDKATIFKTLKEVLQKFGNEGLNFEYGCCIFPISPLISNEVLSNGFEILKSNFNYDSLLPVGAYSHPIERSYMLEKNFNTLISNPEYQGTMTQDLPKRYFDTGQFYWFEINKILNDSNLITDKTYGLILNELQFQDVDNYDDWELLKLKYQYKQLNENKKK